MKQQRVRLMKQIKEESENFRKWKMEQDKKLMQLKAKDRKREVSFIISDTCIYVTRLKLWSIICRSTLTVKVISSLTKKGQLLFYIDWCSRQLINKRNDSNYLLISDFCINGLLTLLRIS